MKLSKKELQEIVSRIRAHGGSYNSIAIEDDCKKLQDHVNALDDDSSNPPGNPPPPPPGPSHG